jgi:hypothetical protein
MQSLTALAISFPLLIGSCLRPEPIVDPKTFFCLNTEDFRYTQEELDARQAGGWTANLAREFRITARRDAWCVQSP